MRLAISGRPNFQNAKNLERGNAKKFGPRGFSCFPQHSDTRFSFAMFNA
jgi:hypothetical protein